MLRVLMASALLLAPALVVLAPPAAAATVVVQSRVVPAYDGTPLAVTTFWTSDVSNASRVPFVLLASEWGDRRLTIPSGRVSDLVLAGFGVVTWDARGFGQSGGVAHYASLQHEVQDAKRLVDLVVETAPVAFENGTDPLLGVEGVGAGGGVALLLASVDPRVDAVVSKDGFSDLGRALAPGGVPKLDRLREVALVGEARACTVGLQRRLAPCVAEEVRRWWSEAEVDHRPSEATLEDWRVRSPLTHHATIQAPVLFQQGFPDTLFDVDQAYHLGRALYLRGVSSKMWVYDGGHGVLGTQATEARDIATAWLRCHARAPADCTGLVPGHHYFDATRTWRTTSTWPPPQVSRTTLFSVGPFTGGPVPLGELALVGARPECQEECDAVVDTLDGAGGIVLRQCAPGASCGTMTGGASVRLTVSTLGAEGVLFVSLGIRTPDGRVTPLAGQVTPVRLEPTIQTLDLTLDLPEVTAAPQGSEQLVLHFQTSTFTHGGARTPFVVEATGRVTWLASS